MEAATRRGGIGGDISTEETPPLSCISSEGGGGGGVLTENPVGGDTSTEEIPPPSRKVIRQQRKYPLCLTFRVREEVEGDATRRREGLSSLCWFCFVVSKLY